MKSHYETNADNISDLWPTHDREDEVKGQKYNYQMRCRFTLYDATLLCSFETLYYSLTTNQHIQSREIERERD